MILTPDEKNILEQIYGRITGYNFYNPESVTEIRELTPNESRFFGSKTFVSPHFCVQTLYKISGEIAPMRFNRAVHKLLDADENFRANFCNVGTRALKIIRADRGTFPEIIFRILNLEGAELDETLTRIMEADRRRDFDIQRDYLIRFAAFRTAPDEAAVLITMSQLLFERFNSESFFRAVFEDEKYEKLEPKASAPVPHVEERVREYWAQVLKDLPVPPKVPCSKKAAGAYLEKSYRMIVPPDILSDLKVNTQSSRAMLQAALQTAWGFVLQAMNSSTDATFCQLVSSVSAGGEFSLNLIPVRIKSDKPATVESIVEQQFRQLVVSRPYSFFDWAALEDLKIRRDRLFDHFVSFLDFKAEEKSFTQTRADGVISRHSWDAQGMKLGVYFQFAGSLSVTFQYDANQFLQNAGGRLAKLFALVLRQMLVYWHAPFASFMENFQKLALAELDFVEQAAQEDARKIIVDFISRSEILQGEFTGLTQEFAGSAKLVTCFEGDRISGATVDDNLVFVVEGKIARNVDTGDGWFKTLDIIKGGGWVNETIFLEKRRTTLSAEILTETATLLLIPLTKIQSVMRERPEISRAIIAHVLRQLEKYQALWLQN